MSEELAKIDIPEAPGGVGVVQENAVVVFNDQKNGMPDHLASDCRLATTILNHGCIPKEKIDQLLNRAVDRGLHENVKTRDLVAVVRMLDAVARTELRTRQYANPIAQQHQHTHVHGGAISVGPPKSLADRAAALYSEVQQELARRGVIIDEPPGAPIGPALGHDGTSDGAGTVATGSNGNANGVPISPTGG